MQTQIMVDFLPLPIIRCSPHTHVLSFYTTKLLIEFRNTNLYSCIKLYFSFLAFHNIPSIIYLAFHNLGSSFKYLPYFLSYCRSYSKSVFQNSFLVLLSDISCSFHIFTHMISLYLVIISHPPIIPC